MKNQYKARQDKRYILFKILCLLLLSVTAAGCSIAKSRSLRDTTAQPDVVFYQAVKIIEDNYIDVSGKTVKLDTSGRPDINTLLMQLDYSATLLTPAELVILSNPLKAAIGIGFSMKDGVWYVRRAMKDLPAHHAGIRSGARILEIDDTPVDGISFSKLYAKLQGNPGSEIELVILDTDNQTKRIRVRRQIIDPGPAINDRMLGDTMGYIRINRFDYGISDKVKTALKELLKSNMRSLLLDLRRNVGGSTDEVVKIAALFLNRNTLIAHISGASQHDLKTRNWNSYTDIPLAVLIDNGTSSSGEILAAALRDVKRSVLIGDKTAGNGALYTSFYLEDGSLLNIRTYYVSSPSGKAIEGQGIEPNVQAMISDAERETLDEKQISYDDKTDNPLIGDSQLDKAISYVSEELKKAKTATR